jgi:hypothetical protein
MHRALVRSLCWAGVLLGQAAVVVAQTPAAPPAPAKPQTAAKPKKTAGSGTSHVPEPKTEELSVNGLTGEATVLLIRGNTFVSLENLARVANGTISFQDNRVSLTIPGPEEPAAAPAPPTEETRAPPPPSGLSTEFMRAGIEATATMREWRSTLAFAVQNSYQVNVNYIDDYRGRAAENLRLATVSVSTPQDKSALPLLNHEFESLRTWSDKVVAQRQAMNAELAINPQAILGDPQFQQISTCGQFLSNMLASGEFQDDPSCH